MSKKTTVGVWIFAILVVIGIVIAAIVVRNGVKPTAPAPVATSAPATAASTIQHPIAQARSGPAAASTAALPTLDESDRSVTKALAALAGGKGLQALLVNTHIIPRIVATVDALPRRELGPNVLPLHTPKGDFLTTDVDGKPVIAKANFARYATYMKLVKDTDPKALVDWYVRYYPLFQKAYQQLGYPKGYFNDRLIVAIDNLLATPQPGAPIALTQPNVRYEYANASLQSLSAGQKMLLRVGPANEAAIKAKLHAIRADLTAKKLPAAATSTAPPAAASTAPAASSTAG